MIDFTAVLIYFFAVIDPIGTIPVFIAVTRGFDGRTKRKIALIATAAATVVLVFRVHEDLGPCFVGCYSLRNFKADKLETCRPMQKPASNKTMTSKALGIETPQNRN